MRCSALKADGGRCKADALSGAEWCYSHHPDHAEERRHRARKGGKAGGKGRPGAGEVAAIREKLRSLTEDVLAGGVEPKIGAVLCQLLNARTRLLEAEMKVKDQRELEERLERLEAAARGGPYGQAG